ncbi:TPA: hypothetical protein NKU97_003392 [Vibrio parahaemolyticus]|uniref:hypothetical protein n=1 Tax=Vibrio parahaemolyticus TaxID=670 RepID=UPI0004DF9130|nr:hypothetical protein [Vibrio parahaemolyticus]EJG0324251.1 hypothetical protein [Vibrio parahaemolyticus]HCH3681705.1 hypothetical protein [Vibrio parahaemolyticus]
MNNLLKLKSIASWLVLTLSSLTFFGIGYSFLLPILKSDGYHLLSTTINENPALNLIVDVNATVIEKITLAGSLIVFCWAGLLCLYATEAFSIEDINKIGRLLEYFKGSFILLTLSFSSFMLGAVVKSLCESGYWDIWGELLAINLALVVFSFWLKKWKIFRFKLKPNGHLSKHPKFIAGVVFVIAFAMFFGSSIYPEISLFIDLYKLLVA